MAFIKSNKPFNRIKGMLDNLRNQAGKGNLNSLKKDLRDAYSTDEGITCLASSATGISATVIGIDK